MRASGRGEDPRRDLLRLVVELEASRNRIPDSIADGQLARLLERVAFAADRLAQAGTGASQAPWWSVVHNMLYTDVMHEALMLSRLAAALKARMEHTGLATVSGTDYFRARLDRLLEKLREGLGFNPKIPLYLYWGGPERWRGLRPP